MGYEKIDGAISIVSNIYGSATGYGNQITYMVDRLKRHKADVAMLANYGLEGRFDTIASRFGKVPVYPRGYAPHSQDVIGLWHDHFSEKHADKKNVLFTLYDVWVYNQLKFDGPIVSWVPLDHVTLPPDVARFLIRDNVAPITMSPHGQRQLEAAGIDSIYIPHAIDTNVYKPTETIDGKKTREWMNIDEDTFLVTMVSANKANGIQHRKAYGEALTAFAMFHKENPNSHLYIHAESGNAFGGFVLPRILQALGVPEGAVTVADPNMLRIGYPVETMAAIYTASDVLLMPSYGEGFGIPLLEAQSAGTRVVTGSWTAMADLAGPSSWCIAGQPLWDETQAAFYNMPLISSMIQALKLAYDAPRGYDDASREFAKQFDVEKVWSEKWLPFWKGVFG
mgnify:CR=1 FL=1